jgi:hypothetical protein
LAASVCVDDRSSSARDSTSISSAVSLSAYEIAQLRCLLDAWDSSPTGSTSSATDFSSIERPPPPSPGTSPWLLDSGASFHMTHDSSLLNYVRPVDPPVRVLNADGTPSQSLVEAFLVLPCFMSLLLRMFLSLTCSSFLVVRLLTLVVASLSTLIPFCSGSSHWRFAWCWPPTP